MRKSVWAALIASAFATPASAVTIESALSSNYFGVAGGYEISDSSRDAEDGYGVQVTFGVPLSYTKGAIELNYWDVRRDRALDGELDFQSALMVNYVQDFGALSIFKPYVTIGIGAVQEDVLGSKHTHPAMDAGFGTLIALPWQNLSVRTEARAEDTIGTVPKLTNTDRTTKAEHRVLRWRPRSRPRVSATLSGATTGWCVRRR